MIEKQNRNAHIGRNVESLFKNSIIDHPSVINNIKDRFKISGDYEAAITSGIHGEKADVKLGFSCGHNIDANIKAYKGSGFNQLTRASVSRFADLFNLNENEQRNLEEIVTEKSKNTKNHLFVRKDDIVIWNHFFNTNLKKILKWGFSFKSSREILVLYSRDANTMRIYTMKDVLSKIPKKVTFTRGGANIGGCVLLQRKGGNGSLSKTIPKHDIKHPGNDIQLKLKVSKLVNLLEDVIVAEYIV